MVKDAPGATVPAETGDLAALVSAPKFSQVVIGRRGDPVTMVVPDPRALALHKLWLSQQEDREPAKRSGTACQATALAELILRYLPQYYFFSAELHLFPAEVARQAENLVEGYETTAGPGGRNTRAPRASGSKEKEQAKDRGAQEFARSRVHAYI